MVEGGGVVLFGFSAFDEDDLGIGRVSDFFVKTVLLLKFSFHCIY